MTLVRRTAPRFIRGALLGAAAQLAPPPARTVLGRWIKKSGRSSRRARFQNQHPSQNATALTLILAVALKQPGILPVKTLPNPLRRIGRISTRQIPAGCEALAGIGHQAIHGISRSRA